MKECSCCGKKHYTFDNLTYVGQGMGGHYVNCTCNSTLVIHEDLYHEMLLTEEREYEEEEQFYREHINWGRI
jgi:hypothetical protein